MHESSNSMITILTERGQTSVPSALRKEAKLKPGQKLHWEKVSEHEFRVTLPPSEDVSGPLAMMGYAKKFRPKDIRPTKEWMKELREGEEDVGR